MRLRRLGRGRAALVGLIAVGLLAGCTSTGSDGATARTSPAAARASDPPLTTASEVTGNSRSPEVVDGDTLYVTGPGGELKVRIIGINTPESGECFGEEATDALAELAPGIDLVLLVDRSDVDQFRRDLRYVETADVGAELVADGFAIARRYPPDDARADTYNNPSPPPECTLAPLDDYRLAARGRPRGGNARVVALVVLPRIESCVSNRTGSE